MWTERRARELADAMRETYGVRYRHARKVDTMEMFADWRETKPRAGMQPSGSWRARFRGLTLSVRPNNDRAGSWHWAVVDTITNGAVAGDVATREAAMNAAETEARER